MHKNELPNGSMDSAKKNLITVLMAIQAVDDMQRFSDAIAGTSCQDQAWLLVVCFCKLPEEFKRAATLN